MRPLYALCSCFILLLTLTSCKSAPTTNTIVSKAQSPNGKLSAILVDRYYHNALTSDMFFLMVIPRGRNISEVLNASNRTIHNSSPLVANWASKVQLRWKDNDTLLVICDSCGLKAIDISKKLDHTGSTKIIYKGFPEHTAYS